MGFFKTLLNNAKATLTQSISSAVKSAANSIAYGDDGETGKVNYADLSNGKDMSPYQSSYNYLTSTHWPFASASLTQAKYKMQPIIEYDSTIYDIPEKSNIDSEGEESKFQSVTENDEKMESSLYIPRYGVKDFINDRISWQKSLDTLTGEPGWYYFKIFFKFDTNYGLFGGLMNSTEDSTEPNFKNQNSAYKYLIYCSAGNYKRGFAGHVNALKRFTNTLSFISCKAPWFFKKISGMDTAGYVDLNEPTKDKYIEIECSQDAVDMRLTTLLDLYRMACYDYFNHLEIIPENLRKFDMSVMVFHTPLRYYQTATKSLTQGNFPYKDTFDDDYGNRMSFRMVTFKDCEFDPASMTAMPSELNNEKAFELGNNKIKISYNKAYVVELNEWFKMLFNTADYGFIWMGKNGMDTQNKRIAAIKYALNNKMFYSENSTNYKALIDASEDIISNSMRMISQKNAFGNMYGNYTDIEGDYYKKKLKYENGNVSELNRTRSSNPSMTSVESDYFKDKLKRFSKYQ